MMVFSKLMIRLHFIDSIIFAKLKVSFHDNTLKFNYVLPPRIYFTPPWNFLPGEPNIS